MNVRTNQVPVAEIDAGRRHRSGDHSGRLAVEVLVVGTSSGTVGEDQGGLPAASRTPAALRVVGRRGRNVAQVDEVELSDVDAELHGRGAEEQRQLSFPKTRLAFLAVLRRHLSGVLSRFENALQIHETAIALHEVAIDLRGKSTFLEQAGTIDRPVLAAAGQPAQRIGIDLIARVVAVPPVANLLNDAVALQGQEQKSDRFVSLCAAERLPRRQKRSEGAPEILSVGTIGRNEVTLCLSLPAGAWPGDGGARQLPRVVQIPRRAFEETWFRLFDEVVLFPRIEDIDLHGERPPHGIDEGLDDLAPEIGGSEAKRSRHCDEAYAPAAFPHRESGLP